MNSPTEQPYRLDQENYLRHRKAQAGKEAKNLTLQELKQLRDEALTDDERDALDRAIVQLQTHQERVLKFNESVHLSTMAGGRPVYGMNLEEIKHCALHNMMETHAVSAAEAQMRVDAFIESGHASDIAELVRWGTCHLQSQGLKQVDEPKQHLRPTGNPGQERKADDGAAVVAVAVVSGIGYMG